MSCNFLNIITHFFCLFSTISPFVPITLLSPQTEIRKSLGEFECIEGKYCEHQLPDIQRMFKDVEDENYMVNDVNHNHEPLRVTFMTIDGLGLPDQSWIKYDQRR